MSTNGQLGDVNPSPLLDENDATLNIGPFSLSFTRNTFNSEKDITAFMKKCVGIIRQTPEYREWTNYIKDTLGFKNCAFTNETSDEITIEIHHHPLTLFDITTIVLNTFLANDKEFSSLDIVKDVLLLHFSNKVGFIPIVASLHEKYHNGFLIIPPKFIHGDWSYLLNTPGYIIEADTMSKCKQLMDKSNNAHDQYLNWQNGGMSDVK